MFIGVLQSTFYPSLKCLLESTDFEEKKQNKTKEERALIFLIFAKLNIHVLFSI